MKVRKKMKAFIKKIFSGENLGSLAFFSTLLATLGTWSVAAWMTLGGCLIDFSEDWKISIWFLLIAAVLALTALLCNLAFFYTKVPDKFKKWFLVGSSVLACAVGGSGFFFGLEIASYTFAAVFFWILPLAVFHKEWHRVIPGSIFYSITTVGIVICCTILSDYFDWLQIKQVLQPKEFSWLLWCYPAVFTAFVFNAKLYAATEKRSLRQFFTPAVFFLFAVVAAAYGISYIGACSSERNAEKNIILFEQYFGSSADAKGLYNLYYGNKMNDGLRFWTKVRNFHEQYDRKVKQNFRASHSAPNGQFYGAIRQEWKNTFLSSPEVDGLTRLFSGSVPLPDRDYRSGKLYTVHIDEFDIAVDFAKIQLWLLHFALEEKNLTQAAEAFERLCKYKNIMQNSFYFCLHDKAFTYTIFQLWGMEKLLTSSLLQENDLEKYLQYFESERKKLPEFERRCIFGDTIMSLDMLYVVAEKAKFFFPPLKYFCNQVRSSSASSFQANSYAAAAVNLTNSGTKYVIPQLLNFSLYGNRFKLANLRLLLLETQLKLELEKRAKGKYPDNVPAWFPTDPFTGKKLNYHKGLIDITEFVYDPESKYMERQVRQINAVAIWSSGPEQQSSLAANTNFLNAIIRLPHSKQLKTAP